MSKYIFLSGFGFGNGLVAFILGVIDKNIYIMWLGLILMVSNGLSMIKDIREYMGI